METKIRNYTTIALFFALGLFTTASAKAVQKDPPVAQLKYIGNVGDQPVFQLDLNADKEDHFVISIKNQLGESIYSERVKAKVFTRKYRLDTESLEDDTLRVEVRSGNSKKAEVFTINRYARFVEETSVSKL
jgi:hypothetical protein